MGKEQHIHVSFPAPYYSCSRVGCKTVSFRHSVLQPFGPMKFKIHILARPMSINCIIPHKYHMNCRTCPRFTTNPKMTVVYKAKVHGGSYIEETDTGLSFWLHGIGWWSLERSKDDRLGTLSKGCTFKMPCKNREFQPCPHLPLYFSQSWGNSSCKWLICTTTRHTQIAKFLLANDDCYIYCLTDFLAM